MDDTRKSQNYINHVTFALDSSTSMSPHAKRLVEVVDAEIAHLARRSQELDQETRVTVYMFDDDVRCLVWDKDVLRLPTIGGLYRADGNTALIAATVKALDDLRETPQRYGDHAFLHYIVTDGEENVSRFSTVFGGDGKRRRWTGDPSRYTTTQLTEMLRMKLSGLADNETVACLVPNQRAVFEAKSYGFPPDNIAVWDTTTARGVEEVFSATIRAATNTFMTQRTKGVRSSTTLFTAGVDQLNRDTMRAARESGGLKVVSADAFQLVQIKDADDGTDIRPFVERLLQRPYVRGEAFYLLMKVEKVQPSKEVCLRDKKSGRIYTGVEARKLLNLPDDREVRVRPDRNPLYEVFVQSKSVNRKLVTGMKLLIPTA